MSLLKINVKLLPEKRQEFEQSALYLLLSSKPKEVGNVFRTMYQEFWDPNSLCYLEAWSSREKMEQYFQTESFRALLGSMQVLGEIIEAKVIVASQVVDLKLQS